MGPLHPGDLADADAESHEYADSEHAEGQAVGWALVVCFAGLGGTSWMTVCPHYFSFLFLQVFSSVFIVIVIFILVIEFSSLASGL